MAENQTRKTQPAEEQDLKEILRIRREKLQKLQENGRDPYRITTFEVKQKAQEILDKFEEGYEGKQVSVAGRIMSRRGMGKVSFMDLRDISGRIQIYGHASLSGYRRYCGRYRRGFPYPAG